MKITLVGAAGGEVTGSCYIVRQSSANSCRLRSVPRRQKIRGAESPTNCSESQTRCGTSHPRTLDHTGRLPLLAKMGYTGPVYGTPATLDMTGLILRDSARLQVADNERRIANACAPANRRRNRSTRRRTRRKFISQLRPVPYQKPFEVAPGIKAIWDGIGSHARFGEHPTNR